MPPPPPTPLPITLLPGCIGVLTGTCFSSSPQRHLQLPKDLADAYQRAQYSTTQSSITQVKESAFFNLSHLYHPLIDPPLDLS